MVTRISITTTNEILDSQGYTVVKFDLTDSVLKRRDECRNRTKNITKNISNTLGLNKEIKT